MEYLYLVHDGGEQCISTSQKNVLLDYLLRSRSMIRKLVGMSDLSYWVKIGWVFWFDP